MSNLVFLHNIYWEKYAGWKPLDREIIELYKNEILENNSMEFLCYQISNFENTFCMKLLLSMPELWANFDMKNWEYLIRHIKRKEPRTFEISEGYFSDIQFLCRYLKIDAFKLLRNIEIGHREYSYILTHFKAHPFLLSNLQEDKEIFATCGLNDIERILGEVSVRLLEDNISFHRFELKDVEEIREYIKSYL